MAFHHRYYQRLQTLQGIVALFLRLQWKPVVELCPLSLILKGLFPRFGYPLPVLVDKRFDTGTLQSPWRRHVHVTVLHDAHAQSACVFVGNDNFHKSAGEVITSLP